jgi:ribosomal protein L37AE/L43A
MRTKLRCPNCNEEQLARIARHGFLRKHVYSVFGYYPWECAICRSEFMIRKRGGAYRKASSSSRTVREHTPSTESGSSR